MKQLCNQGVMSPVSKKDLTLEQQNEVLGYLMFLKCKQCRKIKGHGCADGHKQQAYITKEESMSPAVTTEAVFLTAVIDAWEDQHTLVLDVLGTFMQPDMDELVHVWFHGEMVARLLEIDEEMYAPFVVEEKGDQADTIFTKTVIASCYHLR